MSTARLPTARASATRCQYQLGGPQMNKFEQGSSDGHLMSLAGGLFAIFNTKLIQLGLSQYNNGKYS